MTVIKWGKAGVRLTEKEVEQRGRAATASRNRRKAQRAADDRVAYRLWRAGELQPYLITCALDAQGLFGPEVDVACDASEPDVDLWEAGKLYPTWRQVLLLADLVGSTPRFLCPKRDVLSANQTSMRFHGYVDDRPRVWAFDMDAVKRTVGDAPLEMPEES
jgi:hypothetical protein